MRFSLQNLPSYDPARLALWSPVALGVGIGIYFALPFEPTLLQAAVPALLLGGLLALRRGHVPARLVFFVALGFLCATLSTRIDGTPMIDWPVGAMRVTGTVEEIEPRGDGGLRLTLAEPSIERLSPEQVPHHVKMTLRANLAAKVPGLEPGQRFSAVAKLLPYSEPLVPDGFDFRRNAFFQGVGATGYAMGKIEVGEAKTTNARIWQSALRQKLLAMVQRHLSGDKAGMAAIFLTGEKKLLSAETTEAMRTVGLAHLLAIAGLHVGLVAGIVFFLVRALLALSMTLALRWPIKKIAALCAWAAIAFYTIQVGAPVPTRRAFIMTSFVLFGIIVDRVSLSVRSVSLAAFLILLVWPFMLFNPGFQLSFAAVLGLIAVAEMTRASHAFEPRGPWNRVARETKTLVGMSFVALIATYPFSLYHFQEGGLYSVLANTLAIPLTSFVIMPLCVFVDLLAPLGLEGLPFFFLDTTLGLLITLSHTIGALPGAHAILPPVALGWMVFSAFGGLVFCFVQNRLRWIGLGVLALGVAAGIACFRPPVLFASPDGRTVGWIDAEKGRLATTTLDKRKNDFMFEIWAHKAGFQARQAAPAGAEDLACDDRFCAKSFGAHTIVWLKNADALQVACATGAALILNPFDDRTCGNEIHVWTFERFTKGGSIEVWLENEGFRIETARKGKENRPWTLKTQGDEELSNEAEFR